MRKKFMKLSVVEDAIANHCYDGFPRMVGFPRQYLYHSLEELIDKFWIHNGASKGVFPAVYPEHVKEFKKFNKLFFDLDLEENIELAYYEATEIYYKLGEIFDVTPRLYFTGGKGFALYVDLQGDYVFKDFPIVHYQLSQYLKEECAAECLDSTVIGDTSQISRLPFNINYKANRLCIPIDIDLSFERVIEESTNYTGDGLIRIEKASENSYGHKMLKQWDDEAEAFRKSIDDTIKAGGFTGNVDLDLLLDRASMTHGYMSVLVYRVIVPQLIQGGFSDANIHKYCIKFVKNAGKHYTTSTRNFVNYYIKNQRKRNWKPMSLPKLLNRYPELKKVFV
jgi:hypothetical protein